MRGWILLALALGLVLVGPHLARAARVEAVRLQGLALLQEPHGGAPMIRALKAGESVTILGQSGDYVSVRLADGTQGYVHGGFLTGFDAIRPLSAYADRIDHSVRRPTTPSETAPRPEKLPLRQSAVSAYVPATDGGGLALYIASLGHPSGSVSFGNTDEQIAEFAASKSRYSIEVRLSQHKLYLYENFPDGTRHLAHVYAVAVPGHDMEAPKGWGVVTGISFEPWWRPTPAMKERARKKGKHLPEAVRPGVKENPMGPFKIILSHGYGFRIHGNNNPGSIGHSVTSGCIRMRNDEGRSMAKLIDVGTEVVFLQ